MTPPRGVEDAAPYNTYRKLSAAADIQSPSGLLRGHLPCEGRLLSRALPAQKAPLTGELAELARPEGL